MKLIIHSLPLLIRVFQDVNVTSLGKEVNSSTKQDSTGGSKKVVSDTQHDEGTDDPELLGVVLRTRNNKAQANATNVTSPSSIIANPSSSIHSSLTVNPPQDPEGANKVGETRTGCQQELL